MKREIKAQLKSVYEAPPPLHKKEFMQKWNRPQMNIWEVMRSQAAYIRKWIWALSAVIFMVTVIGAVTAAANLMWVLSALTPFLAVTVIAECGRSEQYEMAELEMAARFSLKSVILMRLTFFFTKRSVCKIMDSRRGKCDALMVSGDCRNMEGRSRAVSDGHVHFDTVSVDIFYRIVHCTRV